jgi:hypothetical protein
LKLYICHIDGDVMADGCTLRPAPADQWTGAAYCYAELYMVIGGAR